MLFLYCDKSWILTETFQINHSSAGDQLAVLQILFQEFSQGIAF